MKAHRIKEVVKNHKGKFTFPVAQWRRKREIYMTDFDNPTDPEMPELIDTSGDEAPPRPPGSSSDGAGVSSQRSDPVPPPVIQSPPAPGTDTRGLGLESFDGRGSVRMRKGTTRPRQSHLNSGENIRKRENFRRSRNTRKNSPPPPPPPPLAQPLSVQFFPTVGCPNLRPMRLRQMW